MNGRPAEGSPSPTDSADSVDLSAKPVLDWTPDDWAQWARRTVIAPAPARGDAPDREADPPPEPEASPPVPEPEPPVPEPAHRPRHADLDPEPDAEAVAIWWASRPARTETVEDAGPPAAARPVPSNRPPAHRRRPPARVTREHRARAVGGLVLVAALVGAVLASLVTVGLFVVTLVLQGLTG